MLDLFGLSEIAVISGSDPVSFNATVSCGGGSMNVPGIWYPDALTDGRTPLGVWQNGNDPIPSTGNSVAVANAGDPVSWSIELGGDTPLDRVILFPYQLNKAFESMILSGIRDVIHGTSALSAPIASMILQGFARYGPVKHIDPLTSREEEVLRFLVRGLIKKEIADELSISQHTVDMHLRSVYRKLQVRSQTEAVSMALRQGLV
jgi:DNA-binding CsgD family transcriptional regulator